MVSGRHKPKRLPVLFALSSVVLTAELSAETTERPQVPPPAVALTVEPPYIQGHRPVPAQPVAASNHDTELGRWNAGGGSDPALATNKPNFHAATRVIIDTTVLSGRSSLGALSPGAILAQTRAKAYWPYRLCFEDSLRDKGTERGTAVLRFSVATSGRVTYARRMSTTFTSATTDCLRKATYALRFDKAPRRRVDVEVRTQLAKGDVTLPTRGQPATHEADLLPATRWLEALTPMLAPCVAAGHERDAALWGRIALLVRRDDSGRVTSAEQEQSRFPDNAVVECVQQLLLGKVLTEPAPNLELVLAWRVESAAR